MNGHGWSEICGKNPPARRASRDPSNPVILPLKPVTYMLSGIFRVPRTPGRGGRRNGTVDCRPNELLAMLFLAALIQGLPHAAPFANGLDILVSPWRGSPARNTLLLAGKLAKAGHNVTVLADRAMIYMAERGMPEASFYRSVLQQSPPYHVVWYDSGVYSNHTSTKHWQHVDPVDGLRMTFEWSLSQCPGVLTAPGIRNSTWDVFV